MYLRHTPEPLVVTRFALTLAEGQTINPQTARKAVALSPDGTLMAYAANQRLYLRSMSELEARPIASAEIGRVVTSPVFSPDSRSVVFSSDSALKKVAVSGGAAVTICPVDQTFGVSWDASGILFGLDHKGIMRVSANGGTPEVLVSVKDGEQVYGPQMLPGGDTVLFTLATGAAADRWDKAQIVTQSLRTGERKTLVDGGSDGRYVQDKKPTPFADVQSPNPINAAFSPDGRWVAYTVFEGAVTGIYVQPFPATGAKYAVSKSSAIAPVWSRDGRELLSQPPGGHGAVQTITTQPSFSSTPPVPVPRGGAFTGGVTGERNYDVMPDGRTLGVVSAGQTESAGAATPPIQVVLHWFEELKQRLPTK